MENKFLNCVNYNKISNIVGIHGRIKMYNNKIAEMIYLNQALICTCPEPLSWFNWSKEDSYMIGHVTMAGITGTKIPSPNR